MPEYLSTDPGAGEYLSDDPNAGEPIGAALTGATIKETPWYQRGVPIAWMLAMGMKVPEAVENALPSVSVEDALSALPAVGGALGGLAASPGVLTSAGGAAVGGAGGEALRQHAMRAIGARAPVSSEDAALGIGKEALIQGGAQAAGGLLGKGLKSGGERIMHSALKPNPSMLKEYKTTAPKLVKTLMDEGVNVTPGGIEKLQLLFDSTNAEIKEAVKNAQGLIPKDRVAARALPTAQRLAQQTNPKKTLKDVG